MPVVEVAEVSKLFHSVRREAVLALDAVSFTVEGGEFFSIVGPSGCGKTTLLNLIAGFEPPTRGEVRVAGAAVTGPGWQRAVVFQEYSLFPWFTAEENIAYGLRRKRVPDGERRKLVSYYLKMVGLEGFQTRYPYELSGGMRQRVAIARALAVNPSILLMDEPFGALDASTREYMQDELLNIWQRERKTVIFVTHSVDEAVKLSDKVLVMTRRPGRVQEIKAVPFPRPRDPSAPEVIRLGVELKAWMRQRVIEDERSAHAGDVEPM